MTREDKRYLQDKLYHERDKELLLKDLCGRVPYRVKCKYDDRLIVNILSVDFFWEKIEGYERYVNHTLKYDVEDIKPYLFPLSSMTEEQKDELKNEISKQTDILIKRMKNDDCGIDCGKYHFHSTLELEWLLKNHFDFRGLIPMGLAIDATGLNIY